MTPLSLQLGAGIAAGLMIGIERGWRLRREKAGTRVAGVRTYTLLGTGGALGGVLGQVVHPVLAAIIATGLIGMLALAFARDTDRKDATGIVAAIVAVALGLLAGAGQPALAVACSAVVTLILATRTESHRFVDRLNTTDVQAFARFAVIAAAVLPFLPNRNIGPLASWNPFQLWLIVVLITGFSFLGYIANRTIGERRGVLATAVIGGAYSSTAVTASFAQRIGAGEQGPLTAGILIATAVMYVRVDLLVGILSPSTLLPFMIITGPAAVIAALAAFFAWIRSSDSAECKGQTLKNPIAVLPAIGFVAIVAVGAVATRWAQQDFGQSGAAASLFITGTFNIDAAIVTLSGLPPQTLDRELAALALAGTIIANTALKMFVAGLYARSRSLGSLIGLGASTLAITAAVGIGLLRHFAIS
ncbi:MAG TPA: MgtC/SapB family protein [Sphingomicrobium sp.]|jgi:uncharacterized membrane protein (DUF4010 family)|nr:MgtC/SapB family protein [Sphingomicrobium sp.]